MCDQHKRDLLEILDDRYYKRSTIITSQLPVEEWHSYLGEPTLADAILDRLVHNAYRLTLKGESMRKKRAIDHEHRLPADWPQTHPSNTLNICPAPQPGMA